MPEAKRAAAQLPHRSVDETQHRAAPELELPGCTPEPLMSYLKALGILRLVCEQKDSDARGWWKDDVFWLRSRVLFEGKSTEDERRSALAGFFLDEYHPTPIVAPWNAGSGFYLKWDERKSEFKAREACDALSKIESSKAARFQPYREQIVAIKEALKRQAKSVDPSLQIAEKREQGRRQRWSKKKAEAEVKNLLASQMLFSAAGVVLAIDKMDKDRFVCHTRSSLVNDDAIRWIDAAFVMRTGQKKNRAEAPLLGSGGNIGNSDFSARFMQVLVSCVATEDSGGYIDAAQRLLRSSLFGDLSPGLSAMAVDQFDPGRAGGANMHQGMEGSFRLNPWDYTLMVEGAVLLQSASSRRLGTGASGSVSPFTVDSTAAGFVSSGADATRGEQWFPIWERACTAAEIGTLLGEGRSELGGRNVRRAVDFARAAASLGVDRGIRQFVRIQYQKRLGDNYLANALGRVSAVPRESVDLLREIDRWLDAFRRAAGHKDAPPRLERALRRIDSAVFDFCKYGGGSFIRRILVALGRAERELATAERFREKKGMRPLAGLSSEWGTVAADGSSEFRVACALSSVCDEEAKIGPLRANLEPVDWKKRCRAWAEKDRSVVWNAGDLAANLASVLQRRMTDGERAGCEHLPIWSRFTVPLGIVASFLSHELDDDRIEDLIWGLSLLDPNGRSRPTTEAAGPDQGGAAAEAPIPRDYGLLKLLLLPRSLVPEGSGEAVRWRFARRPGSNERDGGLLIRPEPRILPLVRAGRIGEACRIAAQRLRVSGLLPMPGPVKGAVRDDAWDELDAYSTAGRRGTRVAAALLLPISSRSVNRLVHLVCRDQPAAVEALSVSVEGESE